MAVWVLRVWLPDRPGALGRVATAIGSAGASLTGIDILEQDAGWAIDELTVQTTDDPVAPDALVATLQQIADVNVEDIRSRREMHTDARVDALHTAAALVEATSGSGVCKTLADRAKRDMDADWVSIVAANDNTIIYANGEAPSAAWVHAFLAGAQLSRALDDLRHQPDDIAWTELPVAEAQFVSGRTGRPFRARERAQLAALAHIADCRLAELADHPA